jgi:2-dehydro-3-deoxyphosphogluconate aldolase/(4S)-4-hydroxy-2-oxoglutarate aldolase
MTKINQWNDDWFDAAFADTRVLVIMRGLGAEASLALAEQVWAVGVTALEIPLQQPADEDALRLVSAAARERGLSVGAGTIVDVEQVERARRAGAAYTVSPGLDRAVVQACLDAGLPTLPGVATASEVQQARALGLNWLKAFPAGPLGPGWIKAMHGPFPQARFVATGGVSVDTASSFLDAGARVVALGSALGDPADLKPLVVT